MKTSHFLRDKAINSFIFFNCLPKREHTKIKHICDFSRCRLNVRVKALASNLCSEATNMLYFSFWVLCVGSSVREISWRDLGKRTGDVECRNYLKPPSNSSKNKFWICLGSQSTAHREYNILYLWPRSKCWVWANKANIQHAATKVTNIGYYIPCGRLFCLRQIRIIYSYNGKLPDSSSLNT